MTWLLPDRPEDSENTRRLKHGYRWGVEMGAIDPSTEDAKALWMKLDGGRPPQTKED